MAGATAVTATTGGVGDGGDGDDGRRGRRGRRAMGRRVRRRSLDQEEVLVVDEIYIGGVFSTGWSHQPVLKANFRQAKGRETAPLVPVRAMNRY